jgi:competence protein ComGC
MNPRVSLQKTAALTLTEVLVVVLSIAVLAALFLPVLAAAKKKSSKIGCVNDLKQVGLAFRIWSGDNGDKYPMEVSVKDGGAMESVAAGNVVLVFQVMSNELSSPKVVYCPNDKDHMTATNFNSDFTAKNISYFVDLVADQQRPQTFLSGDDNFAIGGVPVKSGLLELSTNAPIAWTSGRHDDSYNAIFGPLRRIISFGNIGLADGSVAAVRNSGLVNLLPQTGLATNRLAIP